ncbi:MAG TPA: hypothetical protein PLE85_09605, partial [Bacteroidales bacterium]|nr:hypothetical protein [Bacteroidales bacterium]
MTYPLTTSRLRWLLPGLALLFCLVLPAQDIRTTWWNKDNKQSEGPIRDTLPHGEWKYWYPDGKLWSQGTFDMGER